MRNSLKTKGILRLPQVIALYIGAVLGSGILILPGLTAELAGPASLLAWGLMGVLVVPMALTMGLLSARYPDAGGVSFFVTRAFNPQIGSLIGLVFSSFSHRRCSGSCTYRSRFMYVLQSVLVICGDSRSQLSSYPPEIILNYTGMKITGQVQVAVVLTTVIVIIGAIIGSFTSMAASNFRPFMPYGWESIGHASAVLFWCFIGWEAVSHISSEFENPGRDAIWGTLISAVIISILYFLTAFVVVGTHTYGNALSDVSLIHIIKASFGQSGAIVAGIAALFICMAPAIAYIGAASRLACSLATNGFAPVFLSRNQKNIIPLWEVSCSFPDVLPYYLSYSAHGLFLFPH